MLNLFSKLLPVGILSGSEDEPDDVAVLRERLNVAERKIADLTAASLDALAAYNALTEKVNELAFANEIILNIQESLLTELSDKPSMPKASRQIIMPFFSYGNNDDDDLPN